jgi:hypothetical protein
MSWLASTAVLHAGPAAYRLLERPEMTVWGCSPLIKVRPGDALPEAKAAAAPLSAARNEYESIQIVLTPSRDLAGVTVTSEGFEATGGAGRIHAGNVRIEWVGYVTVTRPTDAAGAVGEWPDPLLPYEGPRTLPKGRHQPVWATVHVPRDAPAGWYTGTLTVTASGCIPARIPLALRVRGFALPDEFNTKTAYGVYLNEPWHALRTQEEKRAVYELYLAALARHHVSPFSPMLFYPIREREADGRIVHDFTEFDAGARRYLDGFHFNAFNLDLPLGFGGRADFSPEFRKEFGERVRPVLEHLRERGWLSKTYAYWQDEPPKERYGWVKAGMETLRDHAPGVRRLLTMCVEPAPMEEFYGLVNLWCPVMSLYNPATAPERQKRGESIWWYVCTGPQSPWPNNFIDHPAVTHRIRYWVMEKYRIEGDLYWSTTYWANKNPWEDPQSYVALPDGKHDPDKVWGNGDGFLLYPPTRQPPSEPVAKGPVASLRLALIRDGLEDLEYFRLLDGRAGAAKARAVLDGLVKDFTNYEREPERIEAAREAVAEIVERP